jgi:hypothetical protein
MKFNWGTGIFIVIIVFILAVAGFMIYVSTLDINLVEDNYYDKELVYQDRIDRINNTAALTWKIGIKQDQGRLILQFPSQEPPIAPEGTLLLYRPSDPGKDITIPLQLNDSARQIIDIARIDRGKWVIKLDWKTNGKSYYFEKEVFINN